MWLGFFSDFLICFHLLFVDLSNLNKQMAKLKPRLRKIATLVSTALCIYLVLAKLSPSTWRPWFSCAVVDSKIERNEQTKSSIISLLQRPEKAAKRIPVFHDDSVISQIRVVKDDVLGYNVCLYENVCVYPNQTVIYTRTAETADFLEKKYSKCFKKARTTLSALDRKFCECFSVQVGYRFQPLQHHDPSAYLTAFDDSPTYLIYNWLPHHHLSHFAFSTVHFHSILQHETFYSLPKFKRVLFQDIPPDGLTAYEKDMWEIIKYGGK
ncbi:hypothetical protein BCR33DRAFT_220287 [Rhizoclosmatium globosum]|uniref:Uncharacterized protein n=1 Tax=Rhizoclosmatium globosum TaxID=329046 RepID=A0A1Y2CC14_9FUNG|nr:hypothetical protein BCR33DRAFT_220287 [Rhizoclosmatium globosum]|eukprot:ORY44384.1 hypothetical protein BCR33DRAFT_220287 [Rhizoclosmatium globosum]